MRAVTGILLITIALQSCSNAPAKKKLPVLGHRETVEKLVDGETITDTIYQTIPLFSYLNQDSIRVTEKDFEGKIYVADFFFTSCNTICPVMHKNMLQVYKKFKNNPEVKILSHSIDTKYDLPSRLKRYANKLGVEGSKWEFVHGSNDSIYNVAAKNYLIAAYQDKNDPQGFVHQGWFVLVDKEKRLRGAYDGTNKNEVAKMMADMETLLEETE